MFPSTQAFSDLRSIIDEIARRLPASIDLDIERIGLQTVADMKLSELADQAVDRLLTESEHQSIRDDGSYDYSDIAEFVEIEIAFLLAERLNKGRPIGDIVAAQGPVSLRTLQGAIQHCMDAASASGDGNFELEAALSVMRRTGEELSDKSLFSMQCAYYSITNSYWCRAKKPAQHSALCSALSRSWNGIGQFRH